MRLPKASEALGELPEAPGLVGVEGLRAGLDRMALSEELPSDPLDRGVNSHEHEPVGRLVH